MEINKENRDSNHVFKFTQKTIYVDDPLTEKIKQFVKRIKVFTKSERINFLNVTFGVSSGKMSLL